MKYSMCVNFHLNWEPSSDPLKQLDVVGQLCVEVGCARFNHLGQCGMIWHARKKQNVRTVNFDWALLSSFSPVFHTVEIMSIVLKVEKS